MADKFIQTQVNSTYNSMETLSISSGESKKQSYKNINFSGKLRNLLKSALLLKISRKL